MPLPWDAFYEFARMIFAGCVVTFGPRRGDLRKLALEHLGSRAWSATLKTGQDAMANFVHQSESSTAPSGRLLPEIEQITRT
jgi:hypothetical protein